MVNPFTVQAKIPKIQQDVLHPLYTTQPGRENVSHSWLLVETGRAIAHHQHYIEDLCASRLNSSTHWQNWRRLLQQKSPSRRWLNDFIFQNS